MAWLAGQALTPLEACLSAVWSQPEIDRLVVGVDSLKHLRDILATRESPTVFPPPTLTADDLNLINPSRWNAL